MADTESVATIIDSTTLKIQQLQKAFSDLESHRAVSLNLRWKELEEHFHGLEESLRKRFNELEYQEKKYETKVAETQEMLQKQEALVVAKEEALLDRLQAKRDAALSAIGYAFQSFGKSCTTITVDVIDNSTEGSFDTKAGQLELEESKAAEAEADNSEPHSQLMKLCSEMDGKGLHIFISENRKNLASIREEMPLALKKASDPCGLVLESLKEFYAGEIMGSDGKKDANLLGIRRTCLMLLESLSTLLEDMASSPGGDYILPSFVKEQAKWIAGNWKLKLDDIETDASGGNSLEVHAFLQLLSTFNISSEFDEDDICKMIPSVSRRRQTAGLCRTLQLSHKMPGVIEVLLSNGRQIDAINLAYAFDLTRQFDPVILLKAFLQDAEKSSQVKAGNMSLCAEIDLNERKISALRSVIKCIEEHRLEERYPTAPLQKRILQLEKAKADKRRAVEATKPQPKRPRANGTNGYPQRASIKIPEKSFYRPADCYPYTSYERQFVFPAETHALIGTLMPPPPPVSYSFSPPHAAASYYGNRYQVHYQTPYIH